MKREQVIGAALLLVVIGVYGQVAQFDFINFDDPAYVSNNPQVLGGLTGENISWAFTTGTQANWHPSTWLSLMTDAAMFGPEPRGFHLVNVAFHALNTLLVFVLLRRLTGAVWRSAAVAALFALHPMHVESVAWVTERKDVLSLFWGLLSLLAYVRYAQRGGRLPYALALVFLAFGLMAKSLLVTFPFLFLLLDYWPLRKWPAASPGLPKLMLEKAPFLLLVIASSLTTFIVQGRHGAVADDVVLGPTIRLANALVAYVRYLGKLVWPRDMAYLYPHPNLPSGTPLAAWQIVGSALLLLGLSYVVYRLRRHRFLTVGWLWFLGTMVPMIGLIQVGTQAMADRYAYLPYLGLYVIFVWALALVVQSGPIGKAAKKAPLSPNAAGSLAAVVLVALAVVTYGQIGVWRNSINLGTHAIAVGANGPKVSFNLATALSKSGQYKAAVPHYEAAVRWKPDHERAFNNLGRTLNKLGRREEALKSFDQALALDPEFALAYVNKSNTLASLRRFPEAVAARRQAVALEPENVSSRLALGRMLAASGRLEAALGEFERVLSQVPNHREAAQNRDLARQMLAKARADKNTADKNTDNQSP